MIRVYLPNIDGRIFRRKGVRGKSEMRWEECRKFAADTNMEDGKSETEIWRKII
jgi:hypothetical protein